MAYITGSVTDSFGVLPFSLSAGTQLTMSIQNSLSGHSYFGLETVPNSNGFYDSTAPKNISGSFVLGSGIVDVVYDNYKMVAVVKPGGGTLTYTPAVAIDADTLRTRGTGASLGQADFATLAASSYSKRVTEAGGYVESPSSITAAITATPILKDASFLYIPSGYASGTAFSELSTTDYGDLTWSRTSDGTRTNSEGLVQRVPWNLFQYSEQFDNGYWYKINSSITANTITAPNGTLTADSWIESNTNNFHVFGKSSLSLNSGSYVITIYAKAKERSKFLMLYTGTPNKGYGFDLANGTTSAVTGITSADSFSITNVGDGWYRCQIGVASNSIGTVEFTMLTSFSALSYLGDGTSGIYVWGAQLVEGTSPQSYLPTTTRLNVPRLDYTYGTSPASLMEPQRTNLMLQSDAFNNSPWGPSNTTVTSNSIIAPDGTLTADTLTDNSTTGVHTVDQTVMNTGTLTYSVYAKKGTSNYVGLYSLSSTQGAYFDINTGVFTSIIGNAPTSYSITNVGDGWYRCTITTTVSNVQGFRILMSDNGTNFVYSGTGKTIYIWGAQLEVGSYPSTYIPTTSTTVTRIADALSRNNVYTNGMITSVGGTWYTELRGNTGFLRVSGFPTLFVGSTTNGYSGDAFGFSSSNVSADRLGIYRLVSGSLSVITTTTTNTVKVAFAWTPTALKVYLNGTLLSNTTGLSWDITNFQNLIGIAEVPLFIQAMALYNQPLSNVDMGVLTGASYYTSYASMAQANNYTIA